MRPLPFIVVVIATAGASSFVPPSIDLRVPFSVVPDVVPSLLPSISRSSDASASSASFEVASPPRPRNRRASAAAGVRHLSSSSYSSASSSSSTSSSTDTMPSHSPATSLPNLLYDWRGQTIRYQVSGPLNATRTVLLVHGLFVNSDHWRRTLIGLGGVGDDNDDKDVRVYALDLLGCGWSSKPSRCDPGAMMANGENGRFLDCDTVSYRELDGGAGSRGVGGSGRTSSVLENVPLGTPYGGHRLASRLELRHPLNSPYNFYTWSEQLADFTRDVILANDGNDEDDDGYKRRVTLVANSIGTMSSLQSMIDEPDLYNGVLVVNPNFRELHMAELPLSSAFMPLVRIVQRTLRENGAGLFQSLARPDIVRRILREPYSVVDAIDDELVKVLLDPLLTPGADDVVFDTLSYSAGPLPEQQLGSVNYPKDRPVWVVYGKDDPWTPSGRVENLRRTCGPVVERIVGLEGAGHCPHDEKPEEVNRLILEFLDRLGNR